MANVALETKSDINGCGAVEIVYSYSYAIQFIVCFF